MVDEKHVDRFIEAIHTLAHAVGRLTEAEWLKSREGLASKHDLEKLGAIIMSAMSDFAGKLKVFFDQQDAAVAGITTDIQTLNDKITALNNSPGTFTAEDQALVNDILDRTSNVTAKLAALDAMTPPPAPVTPPAPPVTPTA